MNQHNNNPKIMVITTGRADYGLLHPLMAKIKESHKLDLTLVVTGSHLSEQQGNTLSYIDADGFKVDHIVPMSCATDSEHGICGAIAEGLNGFSSLYEVARPDLIVVLGDRYELLSICSAALIHKIPMAHIHGGEATFGIIDEAIRHSVTKMSAIHFPAIESYKKRIVQLGEDPMHVHVVGSLGIDNINNMSLMSRDELSETFDVDFSQKVALVTYHPVTLDSYGSSLQQMKGLLDALIESDVVSLITMPNSDPGNAPIYDVIQDYMARYPNVIKFRKNLGQVGYLSAMKYSSLMVGNSSSGIIESASFKLPVVNVGDRQNGRHKADNVIDVKCEKSKIKEMINKALSADFTDSLKGLSNPYGDGNTADRMISILEIIDFKDIQGWVKKEFHDLSEDMK